MYKALIITTTALDLAMFIGLDALCLTPTGQRLTPRAATIHCDAIEDSTDRYCRTCGVEDAIRGTATRRLSHIPFGWRPTILAVRHRRYRCSHCRRVWRQDLGKAAEPRAKLTRTAVDWARHGLVVEHLSVSRIAACLAVSWNTANDAVIAEGKARLIDDPARFDGVRVLGVNEHVWRHTRRGGKYVTVIIDLTPVRWQCRGCVR